MEYLHQLLFAAILGIPVACVVWTFTQEELFEELRKSIANARARQARSRWRRKLAYIPTCPYCFSHYIAAIGVALFNFRMLADGWRGYLVGLFSVVLIANVYLTLYHLLRASLRRVRAAADLAEGELALTRKKAAVREIPPCPYPSDLSLRTTSQRTYEDHKMGRPGQDEIGFVLVEEGVAA